MGDKAEAAGTRSGTETNADETAPAVRIRHSEHLYVTWWAWPLPLLGATLLAAEIHMGYPGLRGWLPYVVMLALALLLLISLGRVRVRVSEGEGGGELWIGDAHLPLRFVGEVETVTREQKRKALGPQLDPAAFVVHRGWIAPLVRVRLTDPDDPTPYWLFSTRRPDVVAGLLLELRPDHPGPDATRGGRAV